MPYAVIVRSALACWMFSGPIFADPTIDSQGSQLSAIEGGHYTDNLASVKARLFRLNVFPIFLLLIVVGTVQVAVEIYTRTPIELLIRRLYISIKPFCKRKDESGDNADQLLSYDLQASKNKLRREVAPFTGDYFKFIQDNDKSKGKSKSKDYSPAANKDIETAETVAITTTNSGAAMAAAAHEGWVDMEVEGHPALMKPFSLSSEAKAELRRARASTADVDGMEESTVDIDIDLDSDALSTTFMRTYEIIGEKGCSSYAIEKIPSYQKAVESLINKLRMSGVQQDSM